MSLVLRIQNPSALQGGPAVIEMVSNTLTIGRGAENDLVLPDPDMAVSKHHCVLERRNDDYVIVDMSTNGTFLNYGSEGLDDTATPLNNGDVIVVGAFEMIVEIVAGSTSSRPNSGHAAPLPPLATASTPRADTDHPKQTPPGVSALDDLAETGADFLDDLLGESAASKPLKAESALDKLMLSDTPDTPIDALLEDTLQNLTEGSSAADHSPASQDFFSAPNSKAPMIPDNWEASLIGRTPQTDASAQLDATDNPFDGPTEPPALVSQKPSKDTEDTTSNKPDAALRAFLHAAGAGHLNVPATDIPETMARMGRVMASMITGMREILLTRAAIKGEMRMNRTMINNGGNNPLKFSISAAQAIETMIKPSVQGYLDADVAFAEALNDIKAHEVATMSGMEAALKDLLARLDPDALSMRVEAGSSISSLLGNKKARYWEAYENMYAQISKETEDDFQSAFGKQFARAYEEQVKKL